jgi:hypothetical protein
MLAKKPTLYEVQTIRSAKIYESLVGKKIIVESVGEGIQALKVIRSSEKISELGRSAIKALEDLPLANADDFAKAIEKIASTLLPEQKSLKIFLENPNISQDIKGKYFKLLADDDPVAASRLRIAETQKAKAAASAAPAATSPEPTSTPQPGDTEFVGPPTPEKEKVRSIFARNAPEPPPEELMPIIEKIDVLLKQKFFTKENFEPTLARLIKYPDLDTMKPRELKKLPTTVSLSELTSEQLKQYQQVKGYFNKELKKQKIILKEGASLAAEVLKGKSFEVFLTFIKFYWNKIFLAGLIPFKGSGIIPYHWRVLLFLSEVAYAYFDEFFNDIEKSSRYILNKVDPNSESSNVTASKFASILSFIPHLFTFGQVVGWLGSKTWHYYNPKKEIPPDEPSSAEKVEKGVSNLGKQIRGIGGKAPSGNDPSIIKPGKGNRL